MGKPPDQSPLCKSSIVPGKYSARGKTIQGKHGDLAGRSSGYSGVHLFCDALERYHLSAEKVVEAMREERRLQNVPGIPEMLKRLFVTALEIAPDQHLQIQAAFSITQIMPCLRLSTCHKRGYTARYLLCVLAPGICLKRGYHLSYSSKATYVLEFGVDKATHQDDHAPRNSPEACWI